MDPQGLQQNGPGGRKLHIAHRRTPSELTPLMSKLDSCMSFAKRFH
jgi:hypothetical protein